MTDCMFLRRGVPLPMILDLLKGATIVTISGVDSETKEYVDIAEQHAPQSGTAYIILLYMGCIGIFKVVNRGDGTRLISARSPYYAGDACTKLYHGTNYWDSKIYRLGASNYTYYGATMLMFTTTNPNADSIISNARFTGIIGSSSSSTRDISTSDTSYKAVLAATSNRVTLWECNGSTWAKTAFSTARQAGSVSGSNLSISDVYGASMVGIG